MKEINVITVQPDKPTHSMSELEELMTNIGHNIENNTTTVVVMPKSCENNHLAVSIRSSDMNIEQSTLGDIYTLVIHPNCETS